MPPFLQEQTVEPIAFSISGAIIATGNSVSRSRLFELIKAGEIDARKVGKHTVVMAYSLRDYLLRQPRIDTPASSEQLDRPTTVARSRAATPAASLEKADKPRTLKMPKAA
jgi:hypothetical protein